MAFFSLKASLAMPLVHNEMLRRQKEPISASEVGQHLTNRSRKCEIQEARLYTEFSTFVTVATTTRYLCEFIDSLSLGAQTRMLDSHDFLLLMIPLIEEPPWTRRRLLPTGKEETPKHVWEKLIDNKWETVLPSDLLQMTKYEAQCWLSLYFLTCNNTCRERYGLNVYRKEQLLRLRKFLNDVMLDQLPVLAEVMRYMDELSLMSVPKSSVGNGSALLMHQVDAMRDAIFRDRNWDEVAKNQVTDIFYKVTDATDDDLRLISEVYSIDGIEGILGERYPIDPLTQPVEKVRLSFTKRGSSDCDVFVFGPSDSAKMVHTDLGTFRRVQLVLQRADDNAVATWLIESDTKVTAVVNFQETSYTSTLEDSLTLPTGETSMSSKKWCQIGSIQDRIILQLCFARDTACSNGPGASYLLKQVFFSQPASEETY